MPERDPFDYDGAYLDPGWLFVDGIDSDLPEPGLTEAITGFASEHGLEIALEATIGGRDLVVTHGSGVFVKAGGIIGGSGYDEKDREKDQLDAARVGNLLICELCLRGVISRPFTPDDMCRSMRTGDAASIWVAGGLKQVRSWATQGVLEGREGLTVAHWPIASITALQESQDPVRATRLAAVSGAMPDFVASALISRDWERPAEALLFSWIVTEQLVNRAWATHVDGVAAGSGHRARLEDVRSYTSSVQIDTLQSHAAISPDAASVMHRARKRRNDLAHSAKLHEDAADEGIAAMAFAMTELCEIDLPGGPAAWASQDHT